MLALNLGPIQPHIVSPLKLFICDMHMDDYTYSEFCRLCHTNLHFVIFLVVSFSCYSDWNREMKSGFIYTKYNILLCLTVSKLVPILAKLFSKRYRTLVFLVWLYKHFQTPREMLKYHYLQIAVMTLHATPHCALKTLSAIWYRVCLCQVKPLRNDVTNCISKM